MRYTIWYIAVGVVVTIVLSHTAAGARTWHITEDGTGDAPDIPAAFDSSAVGDTILVGAGTYTLSHRTSNLLPAGVTMISENGPLETLLLAGEDEAGVIGILDDAVLLGFWIRSLSSVMFTVFADQNVILAYNVIETTGFGGLQITSGEAHHNLILGPGPVGVRTTGNAINVNLHHNIILNGVDCQSGGYFSLCNNVLGTIGCPLDGSSFSLDPQFCGVDNYYLQSDSPCAPGNHPGGLACGQIGPFPVGCGTVDTQEHSWGVVKSLYRE